MWAAYVRRPTLWFHRNLWTRTYPEASFFLQKLCNSKFKYLRDTKTLSLRMRKFDFEYFDICASSVASFAACTDQKSQQGYIVLLYDKKIVANLLHFVSLNKVKKPTALHLDFPAASQNCCLNAAAKSASLPVCCSSFPSQARPTDSLPSFRSRPS